MPYTACHRLPRDRRYAPCHSSIAPQIDLGRALQAVSYTHLQDQAKAPLTRANAINADRDRLFKELLNCWTVPIYGPLEPTCSKLSQVSTALLEIGTRKVSLDVYKRQLWHNQSTCPIQFKACRWQQRHTKETPCAPRQMAQSIQTY